MMEMLSIGPEECSDEVKRIEKTWMMKVCGSPYGSPLTYSMVVV